MMTHPLNKVPWWVYIRDGFVLIEPERAPELLELSRKVISTLHPTYTVSHLFVAAMTTCMHNTLHLLTTSLLHLSGVHAASPKKV